MSLKLIINLKIKRLKEIVQFKIKTQLKIEISVKLFQCI